MAYSYLLLLSYFQFILIVACSYSPICTDEDGSALLKLKQTFFIDEYASGDPLAYPKTNSWNLEDHKDCCSWDGVDCDENTGRVISLDVSSSFLHGSINSTSTIFQLTHLQRLNLADNNFNHSQIPYLISRLSSLSYLNLSNSSFSGKIPSEIAALKKLASLDLSLNVDHSSGDKLLSIENSTFENLLKNSTGIQVLHLSQVNFFSAIPDMVGYYSSLTSLHLEDCELRGKFPDGIFRLPRIQSLNVMFNPYLTGHFPDEFNKSSSLVSLKLASTSFSGYIPFSIGNLEFLHSLNIKSCKFSGPVPSIIGNLTQLEYLDISHNNFRVSSTSTLQWLGELTKLGHLGLANISLNGDIPVSLKNITKLSSLNLEFNQLTGLIPSWIGNLTWISKLGLCYNNLQGPIPGTISQLLNLEALVLQENDLSGLVDQSIFLGLKHLTELQLSGNHLSLLTSNDLPMKNDTKTLDLPKLKLVGLANCNLSAFPNFLQYQDELRFIDLSDNKIHGEIPNWFWNTSKKTMLVVLLSRNFLTGSALQQPLVILPWENLQVIFLDSNLLEGPVPVPPPTTLVYVIHDNAMMGELPALFCNFKLLEVLDLSSNNLSGTVPPCLGDTSNSMTILNLGNNRFHGPIPQTYSDEMRMIDLSQNQFEGPVPKSLAKCTMLEVFNVANNQISGGFPFWLESLQNLRVFILQSNRFYGSIQKDHENKESNLRIVDISNNGFTGKVPSEYFENWNAMKVVNFTQLTYMSDTRIYDITGFEYTIHVPYSYPMIITNKGMRAVYEKIPEFFTAIDISRNKFEGGVPKSIGNLQGLHLLNLSNNIFYGEILSCLGNLTQVESLDLSQNKLYGKIPNQIAELNFLSVLNFSYNNLSGTIPKGKQFNTFQNNSFEGNPGLCGNPLSKKCGNDDYVPPLPASESDDDEDTMLPTLYEWIFIVAGYASGMLVGLVIGHIFITKKHIKILTRTRSEGDYNSQSHNQWERIRRH